LLLFKSLSPTYPLWSKVGCPEAFDAETTYSEGDTVEIDGKVYEVSEIGDELIWIMVWHNLIL
jgi:hypothetical protein